MDEIVRFKEGAHASAGKMGGVLLGPQGVKFIQGEAFGRLLGVLRQNVGCGARREDIAAGLGDQEARSLVQLTDLLLAAEVLETVQVGDQKASVDPPNVTAYGDRQWMQAFEDIGDAARTSEGTVPAGVPAHGSQHFVACIDACRLPHDEAQAVLRAHGGAGSASNLLDSAVLICLGSGALLLTRAVPEADVSRHVDMASPCSAAQRRLIARQAVRLLTTSAWPETDPKREMAVLLNGGRDVQTVTLASASVVQWRPPSSRPNDFWVVDASANIAAVDRVLSRCVHTQVGPLGLVDDDEWIQVPVRMAVAHSRHRDPESLTAGWRYRDVRIAAAAQALVIDALRQPPEPSGPALARESTSARSADVAVARQTWLSATATALGRAWTSVASLLEFPASQELGQQEVARGLRGRGSVKGFALLQVAEAAMHLSAASYLDGAFWRARTTYGGKEWSAIGIDLDQAVELLALDFLARRQLTQTDSTSSRFAQLPVDGVVESVVSRQDVDSSAQRLSQVVDMDWVFGTISEAHGPPAACCVQLRWRAT